MNKSEKKTKLPKVEIEPNRSKYAGLPLNSDKEKAAKKMEGKVMTILKQHGIIKK